MMKRIACVVTTLAVSAAAGCGGGHERDAQFVLSDSAGITIAQNASLPSIPVCALGSAPRVSIGVAEGPEEYQLYRVFGATVLSDGRIALVNQGSQQLRIYDSHGTYLTASGRGGEGPGEFRDAFYLWAQPGDTIWVGDYRPFQFLVFGPDGQWLRTIRPEPQYLNSPAVMAVLDDGRQVLGERLRGTETTPGFHLRRQPVVIHDRAGVLTDSVGLYPNGHWGQVGDDPRSPTMYTLFESFARVDARGRTLAIGHGSIPQVTLYRGSGRPEPVRIIRWDGGDREVRPDHVEAAHAELRERYRDVDPSFREVAVEPLMSPERPVADEFPAFSGLLLGRDERVWIREYPRPGTSEGQRWVGFDTEGRVHCRVAVAVDQVLEVGADYVLALDRDDLGVERVLVFDLGAPVES